MRRGAVNQVCAVLLSLSLTERVTFLHIHLTALLEAIIELITTYEVVNKCKCGFWV